MRQYECGGQKITSLSATWVPELELSSLDLAVLAFDWRAISLAHELPLEASKFLSWFWSNVIKSYAEPKCLILLYTLQCIFTGAKHFQSVYIQL